MRFFVINNLVFSWQDNVHKLVLTCHISSYCQEIIESKFTDPMNIDGFNCPVC